ncbi:hypothetical protein [Lewinella sp. JB7]|uniref:hypothetical protein n=1 Tax=Lewinella sp. JB7 TaxID=2962887 RepID=UPI0020CA2256|nr:hypothetical protein [Lewinella sp. JB7]MCP9235043.1 hypothetical protein [Lewinella sp. JB7]
MAIYLQAGGFTDDLFWILGGLIVLGIVYWATRKAQNTQRAKHLKTNDPYQNVVNDTSYNINQEGIDGHRDEGMTAQEAQRTVDGMHETGHVPSEEEFHELRKDMKKDE